MTEQCGIHGKQIEQLERQVEEVLPKVDNDQWTAIEQIRSYMRKLVPVWVTVVLMATSFITGSALTFAGMIIKFAGSK